jgi:xylosylprotein 4-beta-galactosyltransferase
VDRLAVIVPYRNRAEHLAQFLPHMQAYFAKESIAATIHIVEQNGALPFNRGMLCNSGYALAKDAADYVCFHDVDFLPLAADYSRSTQPVRLVLPERLIGEQQGLRENCDTFFGAVVLFDKPAFERVNGFPNCYWGWGPEDKELGLRCRLAGLDFERRDGAYRMLEHPHAGYSATGTFTEEARQTHAIFERRRHRIAALMAEEGLTDLAFAELRRSPIRFGETTLPNVTHHLVELAVPDHVAAPARNRSSS